jgi:hypothetical protein
VTDGVTRRVVPLFLAGALVTSWAMQLVRCVTARVSDADVWWVAAAGRDMLSTGRVPRYNGWSFVEPDHPWVMHEWIFGPPYAWGLEALGPKFFALVAAGAFIVTGAIVAGATLGRARHAAAGYMAALVALVLFAHATARPTWVSMVFLATMASLSFGERLGRRAAIACVLVELAWTNAHGSFPLGVLLLVAGAGATAADRRTRIAAAVGAALVTVINPYSLRLHALVLDYALGPRAGYGDLRHIVEYAPIWDPRYFATVSPAAVIALGLLLVAAIVTLGRGRHRTRAALVLLLSPLAVLHARSAPIVAVVASIALVPVLDDLLEGMRLAPYAGGPLRVGHAALAGVAVGVLAITGIAFATVASRTEGTWIDPEVGGGSFLRLADQIPDGGNVVAPFRSAGLLLWRASQRGVRVFYDSRNDCYSPEMRHLGLTIRELPPDSVVTQLESHGTSYALVPSPPWAQPSQRTGFDAALSSASGWSVMARDGVWGLYVRGQGR